MNASDEKRYMSPQKRDVLDKLREQELALDKQSIAIGTVLARLDSTYSQHSHIGTSLYSALLDQQPRFAQRKMEKLNENTTASASADFVQLRSKFIDQVTATNSFQMPSKPVFPTSSAVKPTPEVSRTRSESYADDQSFIGVDVLQQSHQQLTRIREQRASTLAQRLQQKQEAYVLAEQARLNALHEIRHRAAMEIAARHYGHKHCWTAVKHMYNAVKLRSSYTLAEYKWKVVSMISVIHKLARFVHINASSDAPYLVLRMRAGWRRFRANITAQVQENTLAVQGQLIAEHFQATRQCRRVLFEMYRTVRRKAMTSAIIDVFRHTRACKEAFAVMKRRLLNQHTPRLARDGILLLVEAKRARLAFLQLARFAVRNKRNRQIVEQDVVQKMSSALHIWASLAHNRAYQRHRQRETEHYGREQLLYKAMQRWQSRFTGAAQQHADHRMAAAYTCDITTKTGSYWTREHARSLFRKWQLRVRFSRRRVLPVRSFKSKKFRKQIQTLLRAWRLRVVAARLKRRSERARVRQLRLRRGWAWFREEMAAFRARNLKYKEYRARSRGLLRGKYLAEGFADFRAYVLESRAKRAAVKQEKLMKKAKDLTTVLSVLYLRRSAKMKRTEAARSRLVALTRKALRRWRLLASKHFRARTTVATTAVRVEKQQRCLAALADGAARRMWSREKLRVAARMLHSGSRRSALRAWMDRTESRMSALVAYNRGKRHWVLERLARGAHALRRFAATQVTLAEKGVRRVKVSEARRTTLLRRWVDFVADCKAKRAHEASYQAGRERHQVLGILTRLRGAVLQKLETAHMIANYDQEVLAPLLLRRFFGYMFARMDAKAQRRSDPRTAYHTERTCRYALTQWRAFRQRCRGALRQVRLGERNRAIVTGLQALSKWHYTADQNGRLTESLRRAARFYRRKHFAPAFKSWLRNTVALAKQFEARFMKHGNLLKKTNARRLLASFRRNKAQRQHASVCMQSAKAHIHAVRLRRGLDELRAGVLFLRTAGQRKAHAVKHRNLALKRFGFAGFRTHQVQERAEKRQYQVATRKRDLTVMSIVFDTFHAIYRASETPGFGRACRYHTKKCFKLAMAVFRNLLHWRRRTGKGAVLWGTKSRRAGWDSFHTRLAHCRARKAERARITVLRVRSLCRRALSAWAARSLTQSGPPTGILRRRSMSTGSGSALTNSPLTPDRRGRAPSSPGKVPARRASFQSGVVGVRTRRRSVVNPVLFAKRRLSAQGLVALKDFTVQSMQERSHAQRAERAMGERSLHVHLSLWSRWLRDVTDEKVHCMQAALSMHHYHCAKFFPALQGRMDRARHLHSAKAHHTHLLLARGWRHWSKYACTGLRRAKAQAKALLKAKEKEASQRSAPRFVDDDFTGFGSFSFSREPEPEPPLVKDHRVTVQRAQWRHGEAMHLVHAAVHALTKWRHWYSVHHHHRKLMYACLHRQLTSVLDKLRRNVTLKKHHRSTARTAVKWRRHHLLSAHFAALKWHRKMSRATQQLRVICVGRTFQVWKKQLTRRVRVKHSLLVLEDIHQTRMLKGALTEWAADAAVETRLLRGLKDLRRHRLHHGVDHLIYNCKVRRRCAALQLRSRRFKTHRLLRKVFTNMLREMSIRYSSIEKHRDCARHHVRYHCRHVIYNLFYLRRNRIAKDHSLKHKFRHVIAALRVNKAVGQHHKSCWRTANATIMRKTLYWLLRKAKENKVKARRLRALVLDHPRALHHSTVLVVWDRKNRLRHGLKCLRDSAIGSRRSKRMLNWGARAGQKTRVYACFRLLLSHARKRSLKRRNSHALYVLFLNMQVRRAVSRLDVNVSNKWAQQQEQRLMQAHAATRGKARGLRILGLHARAAAKSLLNARAAEEEQGSDADSVEDESLSARYLQ